MIESMDACDLCGLSLRHGSVEWSSDEKTYQFCCNGCRHVFHMLIEATDAGDPSRFKETTLFKQCQNLGIIPRTEKDLVIRSTFISADSAETPTEDPDAHVTRNREHLTVQLKILDMWCPACAWVISEALQKAPGIKTATCNFSTDRLFCDYNPILISQQQIQTIVKKMGYRSVLPEETIKASEKRKDLIRLVVSIFLTMNVMMLSFALYSGFITDFSPDTVYKLSWPMAAMAAGVLIYGGRNIYGKAMAGVLNAALSMETLITIGSFSAFFFSCYNLLAGSLHLYFDTASMLITLVLLGKTIETKAKANIQKGLERFFTLMPAKVRLCDEQFPAGRFVAAKHLQSADVFRVIEDEVIAADGVVIEGRAMVDESSVTGEADPVTKAAHDVVRSGTRVLRGNLRIRTTAVGDQSTFGQMVQLLQKALEKRTHLESRTDRMLQWFVPAICLLAIGTGAGWILAGSTAETGIIRAVTVMVISCPCALGIAIPLARVAGIAVAGRQGLLVRDFAAFETAPEIDTFVFDKTGTVTDGRWKLRKIQSGSSMTANEVLAIAAAMEANIEHPVATAIRAYARDKKMKLPNVSQVVLVENGIQAVFNGREIKIGSEKFLAREMAASQGLLNDWASTLQAGTSRVYFSVDGKLAAVFHFGDRIRSGALAAVQALAKADKRLMLISGDTPDVTAFIGEQLAFDDISGGLLPQDKASVITQLQDQGQCVAMIGDGINDAPALGQSNLAVAIYGGSHLGKETADISLMRSDPLQLITFLELANLTNHQVKQNLLFSFLYNGISIPIAICGLLSPLVAVTAMLCSSLSVIGNTLWFMKKAPLKLGT